MKVSKFTSFVLSVIFFIDILIVVSVISLEFFPGFSFTNNPILRIILLLVVFGLTNIFYGYIRDLNRDDNDNKIVNESNDLNKKLVISIVLGFFLIVAGLFIFMNL